MADIAFMPLPEPGHLLAMLKLARSLEARGHRVRFLAVPDLGDDVRRQGFEFTPILADLFPKGLVRDLVRPAGANPVKRLRGAVELRRFGRRVFDRLAESGGEIIFPEGRPDLALVDVLLSPLAMLAREVDVPVVQLNILMPFVRHPGVPPPTSRIVPVPDGPAIRPAGNARAALCDLRIRLAWWWCRARRYCFNRLVFDLDGQCARLAARCGCTARDLDTTTPFALPVLNLPELVLCPRAFDLPRPEWEGRHYVEPAIDLDRREEAFPWESLDATKPLVYCSLGTQGDMFAKRERFLRRVVEAVAARPQWQAVVATGRGLDPDKLGPCSDNVVVIERAPQLAMLQRAGVMITHGGLGSIKECITFGVPMIVCPLMREQPGNAARVEYHGLGLAADPRRITAASLRRMIDGLLGDGATRGRVERMKRVFRDTQREGPAVELIEQAIPSRWTRGP